MITPSESRCIDGVRKGLPFSPKSRCTIRIGVLRRLLIGDRGASRSETATEERVDPPPKIMIDGGEERHVTIVDDDGLEGVVERLDLSHLSAPDGKPLPALSLRGCRISGVLDISGSDFSGFQLRNCAMRGLLGDGCKIGNSVTLDQLIPLEAVTLSPTEQEHCCTIRLVSAQINGSVTVSNCLLIGPGTVRIHPASVPPKPSLREPGAAGHHANHFALSLAGARIEGRVWIRNDVIALGGISIYQARIRSSVRMEAGLVWAADPSGASALPDIAFSGEEAEIGGSFLWGTPRKDRPSEAGNWVLGRISLVRAEIGSDLLFEQCHAVRSDADPHDMIDAPEHWSTSRCPPRVAVPSDGLQADRASAISGGIDLRRATVGGQLTFYKGCRIGRRRSVVSGRESFDLIGSALDAWKADVALGIVIEPGVVFRGPVHLNSCLVGRDTLVAGRIDFIEPDVLAVPQGKGKWIGPFHVALTLSDAQITGLLRIELDAVSGRVVLERLEVQGSVEIKRLVFDPVVRAQERDRNRPFEEMSILDMQDLRIAGGINIKRGAVTSPAARPEEFRRCEAPGGRSRYLTALIDWVALPPRALWRYSGPDDTPGNCDGLIVDMRGMTCATWDDADATCWDGLVYKRPFFPLFRSRRNRSRWRLRFEGLTIQRIDSSRQDKPIDEAAATYRWKRLLWWTVAVADVLHGEAYRTFHPDARPIEIRRTYFVASVKDTIAYRVQAIESYHHNKPLRRRFPWLIAWAWRWTFQPSWHRRERVPLFSPQPYDEFARAYLARGDVETAIALTIRRMELQWRRNLRLYTHVWSRYFVWWAVPACLVARHENARLLTRLLAAVALSPFILFVLLALFRIAFGFGLRARNAAITTMVFIAGVSLLTPAAISFELTPAAQQLVGRYVEPSAHFAFDKLLPLDMKQGERIDKRIESSWDRQPLWCRSLLTGPLLAKRDAVPKECETARALLHLRQRVSRVSDLLDVAGWIVISLLILTLSGVLRRDIERR